MSSILACTLLQYLYDVFIFFIVFMYAMYAKWVLVNMHAKIFICVVIWKHDKTWKAKLTHGRGELILCLTTEGTEGQQKDVLTNKRRAKKRHSSPVRGQTLHVPPFPFIKSDKRLIYGKYVIRSTQFRKRLLSNRRKKGQSIMHSDLMRVGGSVLVN